MIAIKNSVINEMAEEAVLYAETETPKDIGDKMKIEDQNPIPLTESTAIRDTSSAKEDSTSQNSVQSIRSQYADQLEIFTESFPGDSSAQSPQLSDNLAPDRVAPFRPENLFDDLVKIDVFSNLPGDKTMNQGFDPANLNADPGNPTKTDVDRHYLGGAVTGAGGDALKNALGATGADSLKDAMNLNPAGSQNTSGENVPRFRGPDGSDTGGSTVYGGNQMVGGRNMSLVGAETTHKNADGTTVKTTDTDTGKKYEYYGADGKLQGANDVSVDETGVRTNKLYGADGEYKGKVVTSADGKNADYYDKAGNKFKYTTEEGETVLQAPTVEEFLRIKNFGGGYTDGRPELQSDVPKQIDPTKENRYLHIVNVNPDYTEETLASPNLGNTAGPETRPELEGPTPQMPPTPGGDPNSNDSN